MENVLKPKQKKITLHFGGQGEVLGIRGGVKRSYGEVGHWSEGD